MVSNEDQNIYCGRGQRKLHILITKRSKRAIWLARFVPVDWAQPSSERSRAAFSAPPVLVWWPALSKKAAWIPVEHCYLTRFRSWRDTMQGWGAWKWRIGPPRGHPGCGSRSPAVPIARTTPELIRRELRARPVPPPVGTSERPMVESRRDGFAAELARRSAISTFGHRSVWAKQVKACSVGGRRRPTDWNFTALG